MSIPDTSDTPRRSRRALTIGLVAAALAVGGTTGAVVVAQTRPTATMAPATPTPIRALSQGGIVTVQGRVAEVFGNKFVLADGSGRALIETGRAGEGGGLVAAGEPVTVQGRFEHGFVHAAFLVGPDRKAVALGPLGGPPHGPGERHGPGCGPDGPPPPPPGATPPPPAGGAPATPAPAAG